MHVTDKEEPTSLFGRVVATLVGGVAGALLCVAWNIFDTEALPDSESLRSWSGGLKWFVIAGAVAGAIGGVPLARKLWNEVLGELHLEVQVALAAAVVFTIIYAAIR
jgi:hypothetical protein